MGVLCPLCVIDSAIASTQAASTARNRSATVIAPGSIRMISAVMLVPLGQVHHQAARSTRRDTS